MNTRRPLHTRGFTIIELLVATGITALLMTLMVTIITGVTKSWNSSSGKLNSGGQARLILDQITKDLQCAIFRSDGNTWMSARVLADTSTTGNGGSNTWTTTGSFSTTIKPTAGSVDLAADPTIDPTVPDSSKGQISQARFGQSGVWMRFFTNQPGTNSSSDLTTLSAPVAVCYRLMREPVTSDTSAVRYMLYRGQVSTTATFAAGYDLNNTTNYPVPAGQPADGGTTASVYWPARNEMLAENVIDFGIRMYVKETNAGSTNLRLVFPAVAVNAQYGGSATGTAYSPASIAAGDTQTYHDSKSGTTSATDYYANTFPDVIEVMVRVLSNEGAQQISLLESGKITGDWWTIALANSTVYTRRIEINAKAF